MRYPIAITGMHRSGTSMITRGLHQSGLGLFIDDESELIAAADDNPEGFWENKGIVAVNDDLLEAAGGSWDNPPTLPPLAIDDPRVAPMAAAATEAIIGLQTLEPWGFKDPRLCLTAPFWLDLVPDLRFVILVRHPLEVVLSLKRRNQNSYSLGLSLWETYYKAILDAVPADRRIVTHFDTYFSQPQEELARICAFAGLEPAQLVIRDDLRHHTIGATLAEAGVSPSLAELYERLCQEAGVAVVASKPVDEGRIRRLILDGAVAQRHAEQRQAAIDRHVEREAEQRAHEQTLREEHSAAKAELQAQLREQQDQLRSLQQEKAAVETDLRNRIRDLERTQRALKEERESRIYEINETTNTRLAELSERMQNAEAKTSSRLDSQSAELVRLLDRNHRRMDLTVELLRNRRMRPIAARQVKKVKKVVGAAKRRVPGSARKTTKRAVRKGLRTTLPVARSAAKRLPAPARTPLARGQRKLKSVAKARRPEPKRVPSEPKAQKKVPPKGPAKRTWDKAYQSLVSSHVTPGSQWLVALPGSPASVRRAGPANSVAFPPTKNSEPFITDIAHIAALETARFAGASFFTVPEGSRRWFYGQPEFRDHLRDRYRLVADQSGAGLVFDLRAPAAGTASSLGPVVSELSAGAVEQPAVLDWTERTIDSELPGMTVFRAPKGSSLPYFDSSVEIAVVDETCDSSEAQRVANHVVTVGLGPTGVVEVRDVWSRESADEAAPLARALVLSGDDGLGDDWRAEMTAVVEAAGAEIRFATIDAGTLAAVDPEMYDVVVIAEPGVVPLPSSLAAAAATALAQPDTLIAGKVIAASGDLESAGGTIFKDRSSALIANGTDEVNGPWHDYVRPVLWAPGLAAVSVALAQRSQLPDFVTGRNFVREWCAQLWAEGHTVSYQPAAVAYRLVGTGAEASAPLHETRWQRVLDLRPQRPQPLGDGEWRYLLGRDNVEGVRG